MLLAKLFRAFSKTSISKSVTTNSAAPINFSPKDLSEVSTRTNIIQSISAYPDQGTIRSVCKALLSDTKLAKTPEMLPLWNTLENVAIQKLDLFTNESVALIVKAFSACNMGTPTFYYELEEAIIDSEIPYTIHQLELILEAYVQMNTGSPPLYGDISRKIQNRNKVHLIDGHISDKYKPSINKICYLASLFNRASNSVKGGYGLYNQVEKRIVMEINENSLLPEDYCSIVQYLIFKNIGSNELHLIVEGELIKCFQHLTKTQIINIAKGFSQYKYKNLQLMLLLESSIIEILKDATIEQMVLIIWSYTRQRKGVNQELIRVIEEVSFNKIPQFKPRDLAIAADGFAKAGIGNKDWFAKIENVAKAKMDLFRCHDILKLIKAMQLTQWGSTDFYLKAIYKLFEKQGELKYNELLSVLNLSYQLSTITRNLVDQQMWNNCEKTFMDIIPKCPPDDKVGILLNAFNYNKSSSEFTKLMIDEVIKGCKEYSVQQLSIAAQLIEEYGCANTSDFISICSSIISKPPPDISYSSIIRLVWFLFSQNKFTYDGQFKIQFNRIPENLKVLLQDGVLHYALQILFHLNISKAGTSEDNKLLLTLYTQLKSEEVACIVNNDAASNTNPVIRKDVLKYIKQVYDGAEIKECALDQYFNSMDILIKKTHPLKIYEARQKGIEIQRSIAFLLYNGKHYINGTNKLFKLYELKKQLLLGTDMNVFEIDVREWSKYSDAAKHDIVKSQKQLVYSKC